jgi:hypothetical protein
MAIATLGLVGDVATTKQADLYDETLTKNKSIRYSDLDLADIKKKLEVGSDYDQVEAAALIKAYASRSQDKTLEALTDKLTDGNAYQAEFLAGFQGDVKDVLTYLNNPDNIKQIKINSADDWFGDLFGGQSVVQNGPSGTSITNLSNNDQILAGMEGGPVVDAIAYAGNAANAALQGMQGVISAITGAPMPSAGGGGLSELKIYLQVDGNTLSEVVLDNDLIRKATVKKNGRYTLSDGSVIDAAGSSVQSSSV